MVAVESCSQFAPAFKACALSVRQAALENQVTQAEKVLDTAERTLYAARDQLAEIRRARLAAFVAPFKALGSGWIGANVATNL